jgi:DNA-binding NarL/FixJ family response regulator
MVREGVGNVIRQIEGAELAFSAASPDEAYRFLAQSELDVLLLDVSLGAEDGLSAIERLLEIKPSLRVVMLTVSDNESYVVKAFAQGACGYLLKECDRDQIASAIMAAHAGVAVIGPTKLLSRVFQGWLHSEPASEVLGPTLTERELEVLKLVAAGDSNKDIANKLFLAESTIKKYSHNAMGKLGTTNRGAAAIRAMRLGLIALEGDSPDGA